MAKIRALNTDEQSSFRVLQSRLTTILPEEYQDSYEDLEPVSMGSASLKYGSDGQVAWGEIWGSFCDLAMAGGPPHKGLLLEPGTPSEIQEQPERYRTVVEEITRGIRLASEVAVIGSSQDGWVQLDCDNRTMAEWLLRAVLMENISCRWEGTTIQLPAGPHYRIEKEVKNVITSIAKTTHYWLGHISRPQQELIRKAFAQMAAEAPLIQPARAGIDCTLAAHDALYETMAGEIHAMTGLPISSRRYSGWLGLECTSVRAAVWMMRVLAATNTLARRERAELFVPVNPAADPQGQVSLTSLRRVHQYAQSQSVT